jgi:hypothetical protein
MTTALREKFSSQAASDVLAGWLLSHPVWMSSTTSTASWQSKPWLTIT